MALPMFASDITFGGDATFGFIYNFSGETAPIESEVQDLTLDVKAAIDDFNSLEINLDGLEIATAGGAGTSKGLVTTDVGKWLDLPIGLKVNWGYDDPDWNAFAAITHWDALSIYLSPEEYWGADVLALLQDGGVRVCVQSRWQRWRSRLPAGRCRGQGAHQGPERGAVLLPG